MKLSLGLSLMEFGGISAAAAKALLEYSPPFRYYVNDSGNMVIANKGTSAQNNDLLLYSGRALELGATNDLPIPTFANGYITYFDITLNTFVQAATVGVDHTFNNQAVNNILVHHTAFSANDLAALNSNPNLMAKLAMSGSSIPELSMVLQGDEQWYPCSEESEAGVLSKVLNPTAGRTIFTTSNATTNVKFRAPAGEGLYVNGTYYAGQDGTDVTATASGSTIELVESTDGVLTYIRSAYQGLNGTVPDFSSNQQLSYLDLSGSNLSGKAPNFTSNPQLSHVNLADNNLSGKVPNFTSNPQLSYVNLSSNNFSDFAGGTITTGGPYFFLSYNALTVTAVDGILQALVDGGTTGSVTIRLEGGTNGVPTNTAAIDTLRSRGCTVAVSGGY